LLYEAVLEGIHIRGSVGLSIKIHCSCFVWNSRRPC